MRNTTVITVLIVLVIIGITTLFAMTRERGEEQPDIQGYILSLEEGSFLVAERLTGEGSYDGNIERLEGAAIVYSVTGGTEFIDQDEEVITFADLRMYDEVEVWSAGAMLESYPAQAEALSVRLTGETMESERVGMGPCDGSDASRLQIVQSLENSWEEIEADIPVRPSLGSTVWQPPYHAQFIGNNSMMIAFEDGHAVVAAVLGFECQDDGTVTDFNVLDTEEEFPFNEERWSSLRRSFGDEARSPDTYSSISVYVGGQMIETDEWRQIEPNIFIIDTGSGLKL